MLQQAIVSFHYLHRTYISFSSYIELRIDTDAELSFKLTKST